MCKSTNTTPISHSYFYIIHLRIEITKVARALIVREKSIKMSSALNKEIINGINGIIMLPYLCDVCYKLSHVYKALESLESL